MPDPTLNTSWLNDRRREQFWAKVNKNGPLPDISDPLISAPTTPCWVWTAATPLGYGVFTPYPKRRGLTSQAHRISYMEAHGGIRSDLMVDHLCRNRSCVNPDHLEAVTAKVNQRRGDGMAGRRARVTHCPAGHPYDEAHTHTSDRGQRSCRECRRLREVAKRRSPEARAEHARRQREYKARVRARMTS
jgi:hypothetical protein